MRKIALILAVLSFFTACARADKQVIRTEKTETQSAAPFGPFFLPENHSLSSVSLNYVTSTPQETVVYFTMVGEIDWARSDKNPARYHRMVFKDLEESAVYQFNIKCDDREVGSSSSIHTMPFGDDYQFQFAVASIDRDIDSSIRPHFLVLGSEKDSVGENDFKLFYSKYRDMLSSTIVIPLFSLDLQGTNLDLAGSGGGVYFVRYKNLCLTLINREMPDFNFITRYISDNPEDQNVIVVSHVGKKSLGELSARLALLNCRIYAFNGDMNGDQTGDNVTLVDRYQMVNIIKKPTYALVLTNAAR